MNRDEPTTTPSDARRLRLDGHDGPTVERFRWRGVGRDSSHRPPMSNQTPSKSVILATIARLQEDLERVTSMVVASVPDETVGPPIIPLTDPAYTLADASALLGVSEPTLRRLISEGEISRTQVGHSPRILRSDIEEYLERHRVPSIGQAS